MVIVMSNKKFSKLAVLSLLGVLALTGCDSSSSKIYAKPSDYKEEIVTIDGNDEKIHNDILKIIYDAMRDGSVASKTLDAVLYRYAQSIFGSYNKLTLADGDENITLKEAARDYKENSGYQKLDAFIRAHKSFWTYNDDGEHIDDEGKKVTDDKNFTPSTSERKRVDSKFSDVERRIAENMFTKISSGSYSEKHFFSEAKYLKSLYEDGQSVAHYKDHEGEPSIIIDYTVEGEDVFTKEILHREYYQTHSGLTEDETTPDGNKNFHYVEKEIVPEIYNDLLVEQYLLDEEAAAVRNSRARQINVIKIEKYSDFTINADLLVKKLVDEIYTTGVSTASTNGRLSIVDEDHNPLEAMFEKYSDIAKGLVEEIGEEGKLIAEAINNTRSDAFQEKTGALSGKKYYANTTYGDLVEDYEEFLSATEFDEIDTDLLSKFTSSGTCSPEEGFNQAVIDIDQTEAITKGWYVQKSAPSLDGSGKIKDILFQVSVANSKVEIPEEEGSAQIAALNELALTDRVYNDNGTWKVRSEPAKADSATGSKGESKFLCSINGAFFLKFEGNYSGSEYTNDIVYDDGSAYYIVQVLEAVKDVKLRNSQSDNSYANTRSLEFLNKVTSQVTRKVAETGNYSSLSKEYWLKKMSIKYHDQTVYDYFKSNYPDLFD